MGDGHDVTHNHKRAPRPESPNMTQPTPSPPNEEANTGYWKANLKILGTLLSIWFVVSYGCGILFVDALNQFQLPGTGFPLGFWFAQQGSIYVFVVLIFVYTFLMARLDKQFGVEED